MTGRNSTSAEHVLGHGEAEKSHDEHIMQKETALLNVKREKRLCKTELTNIRHRMEKLDITPNDVDYADLHYLFVDIHGNMGEPVARFGTAGMDLYWTS